MRIINQGSRFRWGWKAGELFLISAIIRAIGPSVMFSLATDSKTFNHLYKEGWLSVLRADFEYFTVGGTEQTVTVIRAVVKMLYKSKL